MLVLLEQQHPDDRDDLVRFGQVTGRGTADDLVELGLAEHRGHLRGEEARRDRVGQHPAAQFTGE